VKAVAVVVAVVEKETETDGDRRRLRRRLRQWRYSQNDGEVQTGCVSSGKRRWYGQTDGDGVQQARAQERGEGGVCR
jgi:hypothetical protein